MRGDRKRLYFKIAIVSLSILILSIFRLGVSGSSELVSISALPEVPREGDPVLATFKFDNTTSEHLPIDWQFYSNGVLLMDGATVIPPASCETQQYAYRNPIQIGEQVNFVVRAQSALGDHEEVFSVPSSPPQVWSSFVSFAASSTSVMGFMSTTTYYQINFGGDTGFINVGLIMNMVLLALLILLELTQPLLMGGTVSRLGSLRVRFSAVSWILFIIFMGILYTRIVMILIT